MSRELKFRAWDKENEEYINGYDVLLRCNGSAISRYALGILDTDMPVNVIIEQYTGLKDKNGKEIYEGDIVSEVIDVGAPCSPFICRYIVEWNEELCLFGLIDLKENGVHDELWETNQSIEVIGNIHENPELLGDVE